MEVIQMEIRQRERNQRKLKLGSYMKRIKQSLVLRRKKYFGILKIRENFSIQDIGRTVGNSGDSRKNRETMSVYSKVI